MPTKTTAVRHHPRPLRRRTRVITELDLQPTTLPGFSSADSCKDLSTADGAKLKELGSEDETHDDLSESRDGGPLDTPEATSSQTSPVDPSRAPARVFARQEDPLFLRDSRLWNQSNFPMLVVVVASLGNLLIGTDYIMNLFLGAFTIFYLYQIIESPSLLSSCQTSHLLQSLGSSTSNQGPAHVLPTSSHLPTLHPTTPHTSSVLVSSSSSS